MTDLKLGDFSDPNFRRWVDFRIASITEFMKEVRDNMKSVNPQFGDHRGDLSRH